MTKQNKENDQTRKQLRQLKDQHQLTWPQMAIVFDKSLSSIEDWYQNKSKGDSPRI